MLASDEKKEAISTGENVTVEQEAVCLNETASDTIDVEMEEVKEIHVEVLLEPDTTKCTPVQKGKRNGKLNKSENGAKSAAKVKGNSSTKEELNLQEEKSKTDNATNKASSVVPFVDGNLSSDDEVINITDNDEADNTQQKEVFKVEPLRKKSSSSNRSSRDILEIDCVDSDSSANSETEANKDEACETLIEAVEQMEVKQTPKDNEPEKIDTSALVDNQVQCVNLHCQSGYDLTEAPVFVLTYFGVRRRKNVLQKVCRECFGTALRHQELLSHMLKYRLPLMKAEFPTPKDNVVVMDSVEEIYEEETLPQSVIAEVEEHLMDVMQCTFKKYDVDYQIEQSQDVLGEKYSQLEECNRSINKELNELEKKMRETRDLIYRDFTPRIKNLPALNIIEQGERPDPIKPLTYTKTRTVATKKVTHVPKCILPPTYVSPIESTSHEVVAVKEVEVPQTKLPPIGTLSHPPPVVGDQVYVMKFSYFGVWVKGRIVEICGRNSEGAGTYRVRFDSSYRSACTKIVSGKQIAYTKPSPVRYPVGTRVIAVFEDTDTSKKDTYYVGMIAEPPKHINKFRYLVFFDDGYAQYVCHEKILLVCECSRLIYEDIHPDSREFIKNYLDQYPERPMVKLQQGQILRTEWNGKWWIARAMEIDGSLAKMHFDADGRTEWIYRGSTRLGPLYAEIIAAAARKEQGALSRHRSMGIASLKKRNMPYVEYSVDQDDTKTPPTSSVSKNVAKKSTAKASNNISAEAATEVSLGPPKPFEKMEHTTKGLVRAMDLPGRTAGHQFAPHQCGPECVEWTKYQEADCTGINPLARPLFYGFERQIVQMKGKKTIMYRGPCGRRLRTMTEIHRYLRITKAGMGLDLFDFDHWVHVLNEFHLEPNMYCTFLKDLSYGRENSPVSCVNEINHSWPLFMDYSTCRQPQDGVNICLEEDFLVCCDCTDDCQDKEKCQCWQLTIEGTKLGPEGQVDPTVGYQFKRLPEPVTTGIYECNNKCKCASTCLNRVVQHPMQLNLQVFRTLKKGWGIRSLNDIPLGCFICIYAGRLHTEQSANDGGRMYGDEYLAELDYIEVVEGFKEGYEEDVVEPDDEGQKKDGDGDEDEEAEAEQEDEVPVKKKSDDKDYVPLGLTKTRMRETASIVNTRAQYKKKSGKSDNESEKKNGDDQDNDMTDDDDEMKKKPSTFTCAVPVDGERPRTYKSVRELFGDGADDCYIMDAKLSGNIGRYLNHSCKPNVFVQNVFVDTHDVRFPWVAFFALSYIKAGTELTWDYNYDIGSVPGKVLYCYCNNADCRGRLL